MKNILARNLIFVVLLSAAALGGQNQKGGGRPGEPAQKSDSSSIETILRNHSNLDVNGDGVKEIEELSLLDREPVSYKSNADLVLVLVESRLLASTSGAPGSRASGRPSPSQELLDGLDRFQKDLKTDGFPNHLVQAKVYDGPVHQDGRTVIAIRRLLRAARDKFPGFKGVIFVGSFPEPMIGRKWVWKKSAEGLTIGGKVCSAGTEFLRIVPEIVSERSDLVLADLTGNWDALYQRGPYAITAIEAVPDQKLAADGPKAGKRITSSQFNKTTISFYDIFFIDDTDLTFHSESPELDFTVNAYMKHPEMTEKNKTAPNPLSRPEIFVSRINPLHVAVNPDPDLHGISGKGFLDSEGKPQAVVSAQKVDLSKSKFWKRDPAFERRLLIEYFDRNHRFRTNRPTGPTISAAAISFGEGLLEAEGTASWMKGQSPSLQVRTKSNASLVDYINWLKGSESIMFIDAHSNSMESFFGEPTRGAAALESAMGSQIWEWKEDGRATVDGVRGYRYKPAWSEHKETADLYVHRSIYENNVLASAPPRVFIHKGCQANSPYAADSVRYNDPTYAVFQTVEGVLFYLNGVAVVARAKVFYDPPEDFFRGLTAQGGNIGKGWEAYFRYSSQDAALAKDPPGCKRAYTWSILGDWTLRVK